MPNDQMIGADASGVERPLRECPLCHQIDDHPRHTRADQELDPHMDCCLAQGCPGEGPENCAVRLEGADGATGADLLEHLVPGATGAEHHAAPVLSFDDLTTNVTPELEG